MITTTVMPDRVPKSVALAFLAFIVLLAFDCVGHAADIEMADTLITHGTVITMDPARRVIDDGAVAVVGSRIAAVGTTAEILARFRPRQTIDASRKVVDAWPDRRTWTCGPRTAQVARG